MEIILYLIFIVVGLLATWTDRDAGLVFLLGICLMFFGSLLLGNIIKQTGIEEGEQKGAYNQLRGKYEVTYVMNSDSIITDTILKIK